LMSLRLQTQPNQIWASALFGISYLTPRGTRGHPFGRSPLRVVAVRSKSSQESFGKRSISTSIGVRGANITFGKTGTRTTVGLPR
jgi:Protein of unknown function (DUF4236)